MRRELAQIGAERRVSLDVSFDGESGVFYGVISERDTRNRHILNKFKAFK